jgi:heme-degrading monooxygenase HmoA
MFFRLGSFNVKPGQAQSLREVYYEQAASKVRASAGNRGSALLEPLDETEPFVVMTVWESRAHAEAYEASGTAAEVIALVKPFFAGAPKLTAYESSRDLT